MKFALLVFLCASSLVLAAPVCTTASLAIYDQPGFSCTENNGQVIFSGFSFLDTGSITPLPGDSAITVQPLLSGLEIDAGFAAPAGTQLDAVLRYSESISPGFFVSDALSILGFGQSGSGSIDVAESVCLGSAPSANGACPAQVASLNVFANASGIKQTDSVTFSSMPTVLGITKDISVSGGNAAANLSLVDNVTPASLSPVPEPSTLGMLGGGVLALGLVKRSLAKRR